MTTEATRSRTITGIQQPGSSAATPRTAVLAQVQGSTHPPGGAGLRPDGAANAPRPSRAEGSEGTIGGTAPPLPPVPAPQPSPKGGESVAAAGRGKPAAEPVKEAGEAPKLPDPATQM